MAITAFSSVQERTQIVLTQVEIQERNFRAQYTRKGDFGQEQINIASTNLTVKATQLVIDIESIENRSLAIFDTVDQIGALLERLEAAKERFSTLGDDEDPRSVIADLLKGLEIDTEV